MFEEKKNSTSQLELMYLDSVKEVFNSKIGNSERLNILILSFSVLGESFASQLMQFYRDYGTWETCDAPVHRFLEMKFSKGLEIVNMEPFPKGNYNKEYWKSFDAIVPETAWSSRNKAQEVTNQAYLSFCELSVSKPDMLELWSEKCMQLAKEGCSDFSLTTHPSLKHQGFILFLTHIIFFPTLFGSCAIPAYIKPYASTLCKWICNYFRTLNTTKHEPEFREIVLELAICICILQDFVNKEMIEAVQIYGASFHSNVECISYIGTKNRFRQHVRYHTLILRLMFQNQLLRLNKK